MRRLLFAPLLALALAPALAFAQPQSQPPAKAQPITCADLPKAAAFVDTRLKPGPNTDKARRHLAAAKSAKSESQCVAELKRVDYYAKRSLAADKRTAAKSGS